MKISHNECMKIFFFLGLVLISIELVEANFNNEKSETEKRYSTDNSHPEDNHKQLSDSDYQDEIDVLEDVKRKNIDIVEQTSVLSNDQFEHQKITNVNIVEETHGSINGESLESQHGDLSESEHNTNGDQVEMVEDIDDKHIHTISELFQATSEEETAEEYINDDIAPKIKVVPVQAYIEEINDSHQEENLEDSLEASEHFQGTLENSKEPAEEYVIADFEVENEVDYQNTDFDFDEEDEDDDEYYEDYDDDNDDFEEGDDFYEDELHDNNLRYDSNDIVAFLMNSMSKSESFKSEVEAENHEDTVEDAGYDHFVIDDSPKEVHQPGYHEVKQAEEILGLRQKVKKESIEAIAQKPNYRKAYALLNTAKDLGNDRAKVLLGMSHLTGEHEPYVSHNTTLAHELFEEAAQSGLPGAQKALGVLFSTGIESNSSQSKALLYYTFAALGGDPFAQMSLAFRYWNGISVAQSCESALKYYTLVADDVARKVGHVGTGQIVLRIRLIEEEEAPQNSPLLDEDLVQYYQFLADKGDLQAQLGLGQLYLQGGRGVERNPKLAQHYFSAAAKAGNTNAYGYLGKIAIQMKEYDLAVKYFTQAIKDPMGQWGMGMLYYNGWGIAQDYNQALSHFTLAAQQGHTEAELQLGLMHLSGIGVDKDYGLALKHFNVASKSGHVLAFYNLGMMHAAGVGVMRNCQTAAELLKNVAERGPWANELMDAHNLYHKGQVDSALIKYLILAEQGYEVAQTNAAYILDKETTEFIQNMKSRYKRAFVNWKRAAAQGFGGARLKLGDYYYYGQGTDEDAALAAEQYQIAIDVDSNPQAMFNLGYMHELGIGRQQDIHLAKRYYDMAASASVDAHVPTMLANAKLQTKMHIEWLIQCYIEFTFAKLWAGLVVFLSLHVERVSSIFNYFANFLLELDNNATEDWDIYLMSILAVVLGLVMAFRGHNHRVAQMRAAAQPPQPNQ